MLGIKIAGPIRKQDKWFLDVEEKWLGTQPLHWSKKCSRCLQFYVRRGWPSPDVCEDYNHCYHPFREVIARAQRKVGYRGWLQLNVLDVLLSYIKAIPAIEGSTPKETSRRY